MPTNRRFLLQRRPDGTPVDDRIPTLAPGEQAQTEGLRVAVGGEPVHHLDDPVGLAPVVVVSPRTTMPLIALSSMNSTRAGGTASARRGRCSRTSA